MSVFLLKRLRPLPAVAAFTCLALMATACPLSAKDLEKPTVASDSEKATAALATTERPLPTPPPHDPKFQPDPRLGEICQKRMRQVKGNAKGIDFDRMCSQARQLSACTSVKGEPIFHIDKTGQADNAQQRKILVFSLVHGDEEESAAVGRAWVNRLGEIETRNSWRVIPILNPDGWDLKTRTNANGVDVNRNFPSRDWNELALKYWEAKAGKNKRRFPGGEPGSEPETLCAMQHIAGFAPDFIISVHTPLGVLDFDGPRVAFPKFKPLPWVSLGNFPGSLGRYMWLDRNVPVLTVELKADHQTDRLEEFDRLQDITGTVAIQAEKALETSRKKKPSGDNQNGSRAKPGSSPSITSNDAPENAHN